MTIRVPASTIRARRWLPLLLAAALAAAPAFARPERSSQGGTQARTIAGPQAEARPIARSPAQARTIALPLAQVRSNARPLAQAPVNARPHSHARPATRHRPHAPRLAARAGTADPLRGHASYYAPRFHGRRTANGERYDAGSFTAAHRTLPFGTRVEVTNTLNQRSVVVQVNDRGPMRAGRVIDVSRAAAAELGILASGWAPVTLRIADGGAVETPPASEASEDSLTLSM